MPHYCRWHWILNQLSGTKGTDKSLLLITDSKCRAFYHCMASMWHLNWTGHLADWLLNATSITNFIGTVCWQMVATHEVAIEHCYARTNCSWPPQNHCGTIACALSLGWLHSNLDYNVLAVGLKQVKPLNLYEKAFACWEGHPRNRCKETVNLSYCFISRPTTFIRVYFKITYCKIASSNSSRLETDVGFFRLLMKGIFGHYVLWPFHKKLIF